MSWALNVRSRLGFQQRARIPLPAGGRSHSKPVCDKVDPSDVDRARFTDAGKPFASADIGGGGR